MHAIAVEGDGTLRWREVPDPVPGPGEALVEVHAAGVNRADLAQRAGRYPPPAGASEILGLECAGIVLEAPAGSEIAPGQRVFALLAGGGYAERVAVPVDLLLPVPEAWDAVTAAAVPEVFLTAYLNLFVEGALRSGERLLVHGGASGVGTAAIQLGAAAGCRVFATAGRPDKVALCERLGAVRAVNYRDEDVLAALRAALEAEEGSDPGPDGGHAAGVDVVLDMVGERYVELNLDLLAHGGRIVYISTLSGREACFDIGRLMRLHATVKGSTLRSRPVAEKASLMRDLWARFGPELRSGAIAPIVDRVLDVREAEAAHAALRANETKGKVVLRVPRAS